MQNSVREYLATLGRRGGVKNRRVLESADAQAMVRVREARRAFKRYYPLCFWSYDPELKITKHDIDWVAETLRRHGNREAWLTAEKLCP